MRLLVTGGSGFTGRHVIAAAIARGHDVVALARSDAAAAAVTAVGAIPVRGDVDEPSTLSAAFRCDADVLVNVVSLGFGHAPQIVAAALDAGIERAVFVSTTAVTTTLAAPSRRVRLDAEDTIRRSGLEWTILRPTMVYGEPGDRNLWRLLKVLRWTAVFPLPGGGRRLQQPVHVDDLAAAIVAAAERNAAAGHVYDVAGPRAMSFRELVTEAADALGRRPRLVPVPLRPLISGIRVYERVARKPRLRAEQLERLAEDKAFSIDAARGDLGFAPREFRDGIRAEAAMLRAATAR